MMTEETKAAIARMQTKRASRPSRPPVWQNANGTFSHHKNSKVEWDDEVSCRTDLQFAREHEAVARGWKCPISHPDCFENCGAYGCGN